MPRFLERDESRARGAVRAISLGRRPKRPAVLAVPEERGRGRLLTGPAVRQHGQARKHMLHLPILRWGVPYRSVNQVVTPHFRTREPFVSMSQANLGLIRRDLLKQAEARALLLKIPVAELVTMAGRAAGHFLNDTLPLDPESGTMQTPQQYVEQVSATTGMPFSNVRRNMLKVHGVLTRSRKCSAGLTRGLDLSVLDEGYGTVQRPDAQLLPAHRGAGRRAAEQFARRAFAVGAGDGVEDAARAQAGQRRAVDAAPHHQRVGQGRRAGRRLRVLPDRSCRRQRDPAIDRPRHGVRRRRIDEALEGRPAASKCTAPDTARW